MEILSVTAEIEESQVNEFEIPLETIDELKITLEGAQKMWDVTFKEKKHWWE